MRVAQVTFNTYDNYGNVLQKYALQKTLEKFVDFTEVLWFNSISNSTHSGFWAETADIPPYKSLEYYLRSAVRMAKFKEFDERYIKTRFNLPYIEEIADDYDFFIVGSDQVWNPKCSPEIMPFNMRFLPFVKPEKKIAYAASIALKEFPKEFIEIGRNGIESFPYISVRESNAAVIIKNLIGRDVEVLVDPVFLLTPDEWKKIASPPSWFKEKYQRGYILTYFFNHFKFNVIDEFSKKMNLPIINLLDEQNFNHFTVGIEEFIYLFANATAIFTNSFHGTAFSIIFKIPFTDLILQDRLITFERINSLTKMFGLENRIAMPQNNFRIESPLEIDFSVRDKVLPKERAKAFKFLVMALNSKGGD